LLLGRTPVAAIGLAVAIAVVAIRVNAQQAAPEPPGEPRDPPPELPAAVLKDSEMIAKGEKIWQEQCKLQPSSYKPEFVWDRIHNGFRAMPPWKDVYKPDEIVGLVAYILSEEFFP
jgi:Cytochrome C oxidase, cbb3-type, subunit III